MANPGDVTLLQVLQNYFSKINWLLVAYVLFAIITTVAGVQMLMSTGTSRAAIFGIGAVLIFVFYGYRWFSVAQKPLLNWPPIINSCPDFLTLVKSLPGTGKAGCVDMLGVSTNGALKAITPKELTTGDALSTDKVFTFTSDDVLSPPASGVKTICSMCQQMGVTWEGVWDGDVCTGIASSANLNPVASGQCPPSS
jgi:hypothetical protein